MQFHGFLTALPRPKPRRPSNFEVVDGVAGALRAKWKVAHHECQRSKGHIAHLFAGIVSFDLILRLMKVAIAGERGLSGSKISAWTLRNSNLDNMAFPIPGWREIQFQHAHVRTMVQQAKLLI